MTAPRRAAVCAAAVTAFAFAWAWWASGPTLGMGLNWDTASYVAAYASGQGSWRQLPWNSHYGLGPLYQLGWVLVKPFGGTVIDGVRCVGALAFSAAAGLLAWGAQRMCGSPGALWALVHASAWAVAVLVMTVEDNVLYLPCAVALSLWALRRQEWRWRDSVAAGAIAAMGILVSWQAGVYLVGPLYVAVTAPGRRWQARVRDVAVLAAAVFITLNAYVALFSLVGANDSFSQLWGTLFSRPTPSFFPENLAALFEMLVHPRPLLRHVGLGVAGAFGPDVARARVIEPWLAALGAAALAGTVAAWLWAHVRGRKPLATALAIAAGVLLATALYVDLPVDKYKRYDFVPLVLVLVGVATCTERAGPVARRRWLAGALATVVVVQLASNVGIARAYRESLPERTPSGYHGQGTQPWWVMFRSLRQAHATACLFTLPLSGDLLHGRYQLEIPAALWSELPEHLLVGSLEAVADWPRKVNVVPPHALPPKRPCEWRAAETGKGEGDASAP